MKIDGIQPIPFGQLLKQNETGSPKTEARKFSETLKEMVEQVDNMHKTAGQAARDFVAGKNIQLHEVMAAGQEAQISFQFMMEIRNKLMEAYQEVSRMQV